MTDAAPCRIYVKKKTLSVNKMAAALNQQKLEMDLPLIYPCCCCKILLPYSEWYP